MAIDYSGLYNNLWNSVQNMNPLLASNIQAVNQQYGVGQPTNLTDFNRMANSPTSQIQANPAFDLSSYLGNWANRYTMYGGPQGTANMLQNTMSQTRQIVDPYTGQVITRTAPVQNLSDVTNQLRGGLSTINQGYRPTVMPASQQPISNAPVTTPGPITGNTPAPKPPTTTPALTPAPAPAPGTPPPSTPPPSTPGTPPPSTPPPSGGKGQGGGSLFPQVSPVTPGGNSPYGMMYSPYQQRNNMCAQAPSMMSYYGPQAQAPSAVAAPSAMESLTAAPPTLNRAAAPNIAMPTGNYPAVQKSGTPRW